MDSTGGHINLIKLCVGSNSVEDLLRWRLDKQKRAEAAGESYIPSHVTRMWPKRQAELLNGGSLYWVFKGSVLARQRIKALQENIGSDGIRHCAIIMEPELIRTVAAPRRPFQGWRYLSVADSPADLPRGRVQEEVLPEALQRALSDIGLR